MYLDDNHVKKYRGVVPTDLNILLQFSRGLEHVHKYLIHRDIKPENIFIANEAGCVRIKVGDFGFSKPVSMNGSFQLSGLKGTPVWMAPELLLLLDKYQDECLSTSPEKVREFEAFLYEQHASTKSDVFSAGCVFFYVVTKGTHPFGWTIFALEKIKTNRPVFFNSTFFSRILSLPPKHTSFNSFIRSQPGPLCCGYYSQDDCTQPRGQNENVASYRCA